jgi:hypothetical protein
MYCEEEPQNMSGINQFTQSTGLNGAVALVERQRAHECFIEKAEPSAILLKLKAVRALRNSGETASTWTPSSTTVITTSTVQDSELQNWTWEQERDYISAFEPDYHIPTDYPVYNTHSDEERMERIRSCANGTKWMASKLRNTKTDIIPLIKGHREREREIAFATAQEIDADLVTFYGTQYMTGGNGANLTTLVDVASEIATNTPESINLFLIGLLSATYLRRLPDDVVAAAGLNQWRDAVTRPTTAPADDVKSDYESFATEIDNAL